MGQHSTQRAAWSTRRGHARPLVLVVDDDADIRDSLAALLDDRFAVAQAEHGRDAIDFLESGRVPAVIVLDLSMPVMDGCEFLAWLEASPWHALPVVVFSAVRPHGWRGPPHIEKGRDVRYLVRAIEQHVVVPGDAAGCGSGCDERDDARSA